jgi:hypothetical protein
MGEADDQIAGLLTKVVTGPRSDDGTAFAARP